MIYCLVPRDLASDVHDELRQHFASDPNVEVVIEFRDGERRAGERRFGASPAGEERRQASSPAGRRSGERRAPAEPTAPLALPESLAGHSSRLAFVETREPQGGHAEESDSARLVRRFQAGDESAFASIYMRYFDRVYAYMRVVLNDAHAAEDATQQVFMKVLEALPRYEQRGQPFRAWLFVIVRNQGVSDVRKRSRLDVTDPVDMERQRGTEAREDSELRGLDWVSDRDLLNLIERLPLPQRQVLLLRFMLDMPHDQIATVLDRSSDDVRALQSRAVRFLRERLTPIRRGVGREHRIPMRRRAPPSRVLGGRRHALS